MKSKQPDIQCIDLNFLGKIGAIAVYLIRYSQGGILIETGPGSTINNLISGIRQQGLQLNEISDIFLTHIHLDHAGAAGWLSRQGIKVHVHPKGALHLTEPTKLLSSAKRIYGDNMEPLWGEFLPVVPDRLSILHDQEVTQIGDIQILSVETPGHADHHFVYFCEDTCFTGDIGGVRLAHSDHIFLPTPPPEFHLEKWKNSIRKIAKFGASRIAPTHFGIYHNPQAHFQAIIKYLDDLDRWLEVTMGSTEKDELPKKFSHWLIARYKAENVNAQLMLDYETVNPAFMSFAGLQRYWDKYRNDTHPTVNE
jgi:glyoxylase-like metal-dependent hydrolase (beta-lactamase superfamily II)